MSEGAVVERADKRRQYYREYARTRRQKHRELGLCTFCNAAVIPNTSMCEDHAEKNRIWAKNRRAAKKAKQASAEPD
jgi:hypothetical protein